MLVVLPAKSQVRVLMQRQHFALCAGLMLGAGILYSLLPGGRPHVPIAPAPSAPAGTVVQATGQPPPPPLSTVDNGQTTSCSLVHRGRACIAVVTYIDGGALTSSWAQACLLATASQSPVHVLTNAQFLPWLQKLAHTNDVPITGHAIDRLGNKTALFNERSRASIAGMSCVCGLPVGSCSLSGRTGIIIISSKRSKLASAAGTEEDSMSSTGS